MSSYLFLLVPLLTYTIPFFVVILAIYAFAAYRESKDINQPTSMSIRKVYLYLVSTIAVVITMIGGIMTLNYILDQLINTQRSTSGYQTYDTSILPISLSLLIVGGVVWAVHWRMARREA